jgi:hypothetical protein
MHVRLRAHSSSPQSPADAEYQEEEMTGLYADGTKRLAISYWFNQDPTDESRVLSDIDFNRFRDDTQIEFHGCKTGMKLDFKMPILAGMVIIGWVDMEVDNFAKAFSMELGAAGKTSSTVTAHTTSSSPRGAAHDYRHGSRVVYQNGEVVETLQ